MSPRRSRFKRCMRNGLAHIDGVLFGLDDKELHVSRLVWGCLAGVLFAYGFWMSVLSDLGIGEKYDGLAYVGLLLFLGDLTIFNNLINITKMIIFNKCLLV